MNSMLLRLFLAGGALAAGCVITEAETWPQLRGPHADGVSSEKITPCWPTGGPRRLWTANTPGGFSSFVVAEGKAFTVVLRDIEGMRQEACVALDAATGKELWAAAAGTAKYREGADAGAEGNRGGDGPRSTPAVSDGRVYFYSAQMVLHCLDAASGKTLWKKDIIQEFHGQNIDWQSGLSPVIDGDLLFVAGGGAGESMLAFHKTSGELAWKAGDDRMSHATPVVVTIHGVRQVIYLMQSGLVSVEAASGKALWKFPFPYRTATGCSPVVSDDVVFCTAGYDVGGAACQVVRNGDGFEAKELWRIKGNNPLGSLWSTPVCKDGYLYGMISFKKYANGPLKCVDLKTGTVVWQQPGFGTGNVLLADGRLVALTDDGQVVLAEASPAGYKELTRTKAVTGKCWSNPALSEGRLYVRSTKEGACLELTPK